MESLGINFDLLVIQMLMAGILIGLPLVSLIDLAKKRLSGMPLAIWALMICIVPLIGPLAYWIIKPMPEKI